MGATVKDKPAPIKTTLSSIEEIMPHSVEYRSILQKYFDACPHTDDLGVCNGYGVCDFEKKTCQCDAVGAYQEDDGNCYPKCKQNCNEHGTCSKGKCKCDVNGDGFGWHTPPGQEENPCSAACGQKEYDAGGESCWDVPGHDDLMGHTDGGETCWCQASTGLHNQEVKGTGRTTSCTNYLYGCQNDGEVCSCALCPLSGYCYCYQWLTCTHGTGEQCPDIANANLVDTGGFKPHASPINKTGKPNMTDKLQVV